MSDNDEHSILRDAFNRLQIQLCGLRGSLSFGETFLQEFADKADRAVNVGLYLDAGCGCRAGIFTRRRWG